MRNMHPNRTVPITWRGAKRFTVVLPNDVTDSGGIGTHIAWSDYVTLDTPLDATWSFYPPRPEVDSANITFLLIAVELWTAAPALHATATIDSFSDSDYTSVWQARQSCAHLSGADSSTAAVITKFRYKVTGVVAAGTGAWSVSFHGAGTNETTAFAVRW
ncbi:MAG: hypothetical protein GY851_03460 [bacterium]|nr:hypothetical protein [bacterium]